MAGSLHCPECGTALEQRDFDGVPAAVCPACHGTWFEGRRFHEAGERLAPDLAWLDFAVWREIEHFRVAPTVKACPACGASLVELRHGDARHTLDYCTDCGGVWLAHENLGEVVGALREEVEELSARDVLEASLRQAGHLLTHPGSSLSEWKDLPQLFRLLETRVLAEHPALRGWILGLQRGNPFD